MVDDWDEDDSPDESGTSTPAIPPPIAVRPPAKSKWADEDADGDEPDDWDASDDEKPKTSAVPAAAPVKKKMTMKQKIAEKERQAAEARARGEPTDDLIDTMTEQERRRIAREKELEADMAAAADLLGAAKLQNVPETLQEIITANPKTKDDFAVLSQQIFAAIINRHAANPLYSAFAESLAKDICEPLTAVQTRKVSTSVGLVGNAKQQDERDKANGKKKGAAKPKLGSAVKTIDRIDTTAYDDALDDGDFM